MIFWLREARKGLCWGFNAVARPPSNNQQVKCNEGKLGEIEVSWHVLGYRDKIQSTGLRRVSTVETFWHQTGICVDVSVVLKATKLFKAALNSTAAWGVQ